jgi:hypothetical protein
MNGKSSRIDLVGLVHRAIAGADVTVDLRDHPRSLLAQHGIMLPTDLPEPSVRRFHPLDLSALEDCAEFNERWVQIRLEAHPFELRLLWYGAKDVVLLLGQPGTLRFLGAVALKRGYHALLTPYQWIPMGEESKSGYSNIMHYTSLADTRPAVRRGLIVARSENDLALAWLSSTLGWDSVLGRVLGYPTCCVRSFCLNWPDAQAQHCGDLVPIVINASGLGPFDWRNNVLGRYFERCLLQHFPCTFGCQPSIELAEATFCCLRKYEPDLSKSIKELMCAPVVYTPASGIFVFPGGKVDVCDREWGMQYDPMKMLSTTRKSALFHYLSETNLIIGTAGSTLQIDASSEAYLLRFQ